MCWNSYLIRIHKDIDIVLQPRILMKRLHRQKGMMANMLDAEEGR